MNAGLVRLPAGAEDLGLDAGTLDALAATRRDGEVAAGGAAAR